MTRFAALALLALVFAPLAVFAASQDQDVISSQTVHTFASWRWEDCGSEEDTVHIDSIAVSPDPPLPGEDLTVTVKGTVKETIEDGAYAEVLVKAGSIPLIRKTFDVCEEARNGDAQVQCPIDKGDYLVQQTVALPKEIPRARFNVQVDGFTKDDEDMVCLKIFIDFMKRPFFKNW